MVGSFHATVWRPREEVVLLEVSCGVVVTVGPLKIRMQPQHCMVESVPVRKQYITIEASRHQTPSEMKPEPAFLGGCIKDVSEEAQPEADDERLLHHVNQEVTNGK